MITTEYVIILAATVSAFIAGGQVLAPTVETYRAELHQELLDNAALLQQLEAVCPGPSS